MIKNIDFLMWGELKEIKCAAMMQTVCLNGVLTIKAAVKYVIIYVKNRQNAFGYTLTHFCEYLYRGMTHLTALAIFLKPNSHEIKQ